MVVLPGKLFKANATQSGHIPVYKANGMFSYIVTIATVCFLVNTGRLVPRVFRIIYNREGNETEHGFPTEGERG